MPIALLVAHHYPPHIGGLERVVWQQAQSLKEAGYQVVVLTSRYGRAKTSEVDNRIEVIRVPAWHVLEKTSSVVFPLFSPRLIYELWKQVRKADIVHIHDVLYMSSWAGGILATLARRPILLTQHVAFVEHSSSLVMLVQKLVYATIGRWIFSKAGKIVVYNKNVYDFLRSRGVPEQRVVLLANGIDTAEFCPPTPSERIEIRSRLGFPKDRRLVLFVGRLVEKKGFQILFEAHDPAYDIVFAGPGSIPRHGHISGVTWVGARNQAETRELYQACDLFVFPCIGEVFTLVMQEAMACGVPVITTDDPIYSDSTAYGCVVLCQRNPISVKTAINSLFADKDRLQDLGIRGRQLATNCFEWRINVSTLLDEYANVLRRSASGRRE